MRKRWSEFLRPRLSLLLTAALVLALLPVSALAEGETAPTLPSDWPTSSWADVVKDESNRTPWTGSGTESDPFVIADEKQLILFGQLKGSDTEGKYYALVSGREYNMGSYLEEALYMTPLFPETETATEAMGNNYFGGTLLGNGAQITNARINASGENGQQFYSGLFSEVRGGTVTNLTVSGTVAGGTGMIGGLAGRLMSRTEYVEGSATAIPGRLISCTVNMNFINSGTAKNFGGLVGFVEESTVSGCTANVTGSISANLNAGGLMGSVEKSTVSGCTANVTGSISANLNAGGLVGSVTGSTVTGCKATVTGDISAGSAAGGVVGSVLGNTEIAKVDRNIYATTNSVTLENCDPTVTGSIRATGTDSRAGGLVGYVNGMTDINKSSNTPSDSQVTDGKVTGGLITIKGCQATTGSISAGSEAGGLVGYVNNSTSIGSDIPTKPATTVTTIGGVSIGITGCTANVKTGGISAGSSAGGLVGHADGGTTITGGGVVYCLNCAVTGSSITTAADCWANVTGGISATGADSAAGGLAGRVSSTTVKEGTDIENYTDATVFTVERSTIGIGGTATVTGSLSATAVGGLVGHAAGSTASKEFWVDNQNKIQIKVDGGAKTHVGGSATVPTGDGGPKGAVGTVGTDSSGNPYTLTGTTTLKLGDNVAVTLKGDDRASSVTETDGVLTMEFNTALTNDVVVSRDGTTVTIPKSAVPFKVTSSTGIDLPYWPDYPVYPDPQPEKEVIWNPDGSKTTITEKPDGTVIEKTEWPDGSEVTVETRPDGTVTTTEKDPAGNLTEIVAKPDGSSITTIEKIDGTVTVTVVGPDGKVLAEVKLTEKALAGKEVVAIPMPALPCGTDRETAPTVTLAVPDGVTVKVELPVEDPTPGTVAIRVDEDGTETILRDSVATEVGLRLTVEGVTTVKVLDNSRDFADVAPTSWAAGAVDFVSARELFSGVSETAFAPNSAMTRQMLMTVLARLDGVDTTADPYGLGMTWAVGKGISDGSDPTGAITREELAVMLWHFAGSPMLMDYEGLDQFTDVAELSLWAQQAMVWAHAEGIITGTTDTTLDPRGEATRAQVAAMIQRFCENWR